jgi:hypothetical protein
MNQFHPKLNLSIRVRVKSDLKIASSVSICAYSSPTSTIPPAQVGSCFDLLYETSYGILAIAKSLIASYKGCEQGLLSMNGECIKGLFIAFRPKLFDEQAVDVTSGSTTLSHRF